MAELINTSLINDGSLTVYYQLEGTTDHQGVANLTNNNSVTFDSGKYGNAADGGTSNTNKWLSASNTTLNGIPYDVNFSVVCWLYLPGTPTGVSRLWYTAGTNGGNGRFVSTYVDADQNFHVQMFDGNGNFGTIASAIPGTAQWIHVGYTYTQSGSGTDILYLNGSAVGTGAGTFGAGAASSSGIGILAHNSGASPLSGKIDDLAVFSRVLTPTEIKTLATDTAAGGAWLGKYLGA